MIKSFALHLLETEVKIRGQSNSLHHYTKPMQHQRANGVITVEDTKPIESSIYADRCSYGHTPNTEEMFKGFN